VNQITAGHDGEQSCPVVYRSPVRRWLLWPNIAPRFGCGAMQAPGPAQRQYTDIEIE